MPGQIRMDGDLSAGLLAMLDGADSLVRYAAGRYGMTAAARQILRAARKRAPVGRRGAARKAAVERAKERKDKRALPLKRTGYVKTLRPNLAKGDADWAAAVGFAAYHAMLVELGHGGPKPAKAHPYFAPAALAARGAALEAAGRATTDNMHRAARSLANHTQRVARQTHIRSGYSRRASNYGEVRRGRIR